MSFYNLEAAREQMLRKHLRGRGIRDARVLEAMARVPRERFVGEQLREQAYADRALEIACGQTISQPYIVALMSEALELKGEEKVLEVGSGSGYQTAVLAELARHVVSIERHPQLSVPAGKLLAELGYTNVSLVCADGTEGWAEQSPFDRIIVTAAAVRCPQPLVDQLREGGIIVIPIGGPAGQMLEAIHKTGDQTRAVSLSPCRFVPLIGAQA
jgi:protein-L-isoaspartate(D-aspartate) O-methyltransferase